MPIAVPETISLANAFKMLSRTFGFFIAPSSIVAPFALLFGTVTVDSTFVTSPPETVIVVSAVTLILAVYTPLVSANFVVIDAPDDIEQVGAVLKIKPSAGATLISRTAFLSTLPPFATVLSPFVTVKTILSFNVSLIVMVHFSSVTGGVGLSGVVVSFVALPVIPIVILALIFFTVIL